MTADPVLVTRLAEHTMRQSGFTGWSCRGCDWIADPSVPDSPVDQHAAHLAAEVEGRVQERIAAELEAAADDMDTFRAEVYGGQMFRRPTSEDYAAINALLQRERGHGTDGIGADCYDRAIKVQAEMLRDRAAAHRPEGGSDETRRA